MIVLLAQATFIQSLSYLAFTGRGIAMIKYLGSLLARSRGTPPPVKYFAKGDTEPAWREGRLVEVDPQGASFQTTVDDSNIVECLPWGSIGAIRIALDKDGPRSPA